LMRQGISFFTQNTVLTFWRVETVSSFFDQNMSRAWVLLLKAKKTFGA